MRRRAPNQHSSVMGEFQMIGMMRMAKHNAIEPLVICKLAQLFKPQPWQYILAIAAKWSVGRAIRNTALASSIFPPVGKQLA